MKLRAKHRFHISIVSFLCVGTLAASLCSCEKKETQDYAFTGTNGDASSLGVISVQVREDGSGTRNQFEEYLGIKKRNRICILRTDAGRFQSTCCR